MTVREFFEREFNYEYEDGRYGRVTDCAIVRFRTAYIAYETGNSKGDKKVVGIVCLLNYCPKGRFNFGYKDMSEDMGPFMYECPERILRLLTPTDNEYALEWRRKCWEYIRSQKSKPKLKKGLLIEFSSPIRFINGAEEKVFRVLDLKRLIFEGPNGRRYKLNRTVLRNQDWRVMST